LPVVDHHHLVASPPEVKLHDLRDARLVFNNQDSRAIHFTHTPDKSFRFVAADVAEKKLKYGAA
jgi:hypothetical protein